jgi:hypothetical protein
MRAKLPLIAALMFAPGAVYAQAWTRDQGHGYVEVKLTRIAAKKMFTRDFETVPMTPYTQLTFGLYGEVGLIDRWLTATLSAELYRRNELENLGRTTGFGDTRVGVWSGLIVAPFRLSAGIVFGLPTGDPEPEAESEEMRAIARSLPTGDGDFDVSPMLAAGHSFGGGEWPLVHYVIAELGYALHTKGRADAFLYKVELGSKVPVTVLDRFWLSARFYGRESFGGEPSDSPTGLGGGVTFVSYGFELYGQIWEGLGASISWDSAFRARSLAAGAPIKLAISYTW